MIITEKTKLSEIAKVIEELPLGEFREFEYHLDDHIFTGRFNTNLPIIELNQAILKWIDKCQQEAQ